MPKPVTELLNTRLEIRVTPSTQTTLQNLALKTGVRSYSEVVRAALKHYEKLINKRKPG